jgi:hypothetical protein
MWVVLVVVLYPDRRYTKHCRLRRARSEVMRIPSVLLGSRSSASGDDRVTSRHCWHSDSLSGFRLMPVLTAIFCKYLNLIFAKGVSASGEIARRLEFFRQKSVYLGTNAMTARSSPSGMTRG